MPKRKPAESSATRTRRAARTTEPESADVPATAPEPGPAAATPVIAPESPLRAGQELKKQKILLLARIIVTETDPDHGITMPEIISRLAQQGISAERKSIYRDFDALRAFGLDIRVVRTNPARYYLATRKFSLSEILLMVDAIQSSRFLTSEQSESLVDRLKTLVSPYEARHIEGSIHVEGRVRSESESSFGAIDVIRTALANDRRISFQYLEYDLTRKRRFRKNGKRYVETPVRLVYANNLYYLITYNSKHETFVTYRVDRMANVMVSDVVAEHNERIATYDVEAFEQRSFGMFAGEETTATLLVEKSALDAVIDRFGIDAFCVPVDESHARFSVRVVTSPVFFGWLAQFGTNVIVEAPSSLVEGFRAYLAETIAAYDA